MDPLHLILRRTRRAQAILLVLTAFATGADVGFAQSATASREQLLFDFGWRFHFGDAANPAADFNSGAGFELRKAGEFKGPPSLDFDDRAWTAIDLPHDWAIDLPFDQTADKLHGFKPLARKFPSTSVGWYRRVFEIPKSDDGRRITLQFDGAFRDSVVWVNGFRLGRNEGGYNVFRYDIGDYLHYGTKNTLVVRVEATAHEGWWYEGAGIYRHVWLIKTAPVHVAFDGVQVVSTVDDKKTGVTTRTEVENETDDSASVKIKSTIIDPEGNEVATETSDAITVAPHAATAPSQQFMVSDAQLWSLETPALYRLETAVLANGQTVDTVKTTFGIRTIRFDAAKGFFLNDEHVEIKGVCCHQDHAGVGAAVPDQLQVYRLETLKKYGVNAYRTSHNPPPSELLDACDRLGILVMDETREPGSTPETLQRLAAMVRRDRNHPCVILWSVANEERIQARDEGYRVGRTMKAIVLSLDRTRPVTAAMSSGSSDGFAKISDVRGFNYHEKEIDQYRINNPDQPIVGSEIASTRSTRGIYGTEPPPGYISCLPTQHKMTGTTPEEWWTFYAARPFLAGAFVWTGFDYRGEPHPFAWPVISSHYGFLDTCGFPKDNAFYYRAWWTDKPVIHLSPHWNWPGQESKTIAVRADSNCEEVELFLNGRSLGRKQMPRNSHLDWDVVYAPGELTARGYNKGKEAAVTTVRTTGEATQIALSCDKDNLATDAEDVAVINVAILDRRGDVVPTAGNEVDFEIEGGGKIIGVGNGDPTSHEPDHASRRKAFNGYCQVIVQSTGAAGDIHVRALSPGLSTETLSLASRAAEKRPAVPVIDEP